jgi:hypothetical protein
MIMECIMLNITKTCPWDEGVFPYIQYPPHHAYQIAGATDEHLLQQSTTYYLFTQYSRVLLEKLTSFQLVKKFPAFYGTQRSLLQFQVSTTCPYPKPAQSSPYSHIPLPEDPS